MSLATYSLRTEAPDHGGVPGLYKICENCGRNFFRCIQSKADHCCHCGSQLRAGSNNQLWMCDRCGTFRAWGQGRPHETTAKALVCSGCSTSTPHRFWKVA